MDSEKIATNHVELAISKADHLVLTSIPMIKSPHGMEM